VGVTAGAGSARPPACLKCRPLAHCLASATRLPRLPAPLMCCPLRTHSRPLPAASRPVQAPLDAIRGTVDALGASLDLGCLFRGLPAGPRHELR
jgi:hypothetical protein